MRWARNEAPQAITSPISSQNLAVRIVYPSRCVWQRDSAVSNMQQVGSCWLAVLIRRTRSAKYLAHARRGKTSCVMACSIVHHSKTRR